MKCAIHQPQFLPWLGYLHKISQVDAFVLLDNVQFKKNEFQNRNRLLVFGVAQWVTVPVSFRFGDTLRATRIAEPGAWRRKLWETVAQNYRPTPFFEPYAAALHGLLDRAWDSLAALNEASVRWLLNAFDIRTPLLMASAFASVSDDPTQRLIELCRRVGADTYLSGAGGHHYLDVAAFERAGLRLEFQTFAHPVYPQRSNAAPAAFVPALSAADGLFNCGGGAAGRARLGL